MQTIRHLIILIGLLIFQSAILLSQLILHELNKPKDYTFVYTVLR